MNTEQCKKSFIDSCENKGLSKRTIYWYLRFLNSFVSKYKELPEDPKDLEAFIHNYPGGDERKHGCYRALKVFYRFLFRRHDIPNLIEKIDPPQVSHKEKPSLTLDELKRLIEYPDHPKPITALFYLYADTGCRFSEAYELRRSNIMEDRIKIKGKTGERIVPIFPTTRQLLLSLIPEDFRIGPRKKIIKGDPDRIFLWSLDGLDKEVAVAFKRVGIKSRNHIFRHSFCTLAGLDLINMRNVTGHTNWKTLDRYIHRKFDKTLEDHSQHSPLAMLGKNGINLNNKENIEQIAVNGDKILIAVPASLAVKGITLHMALS